MGTKAYYEYAQGVTEGTVVCGEFIKLAAERFFNFMEDDRYEFREDKANEVIEFFSILQHFTGRHAGKPFILQPWQQFVIAAIYGFYVKETGERLTKYVYIEISRKNGKTAFAAGLCLFHLIADGEMDAEVDLAANSKDQAKIAFKFCSQFAKGIDPKGKDLVSFRDKVKFEKMLSLLQVFAADDSKLDGFNASMYLIDEYHAAKNTGLKDVLQSSQGMRDNPMAIIITTAGFDKLGPCYQYREMCTEVLSGLKENDSLFAAIYSLDEGDDWRDPNNWAKSNPNLGITVKPQYLQTQVQSAKNTKSEEVGIKTKNFNIWCDSETVWIPEHYILQASANLDFEQFRNMDCYAGIDLSSTSDLTCASFMIPTENKYYFKTLYYLPEAALQEKRFKDLYGEWRRQGLITITPGNVTDYDYILNDLMKIRDIVYIQKIAYDAWNATQFVINAEERGLPMEPFSQTLGNFNRPTKELERLLLSGKAVIDNNLINRHCFRNVIMARDKSGNTKPSKQYEEKKIDGVIAKLEALGIYLVSPRYGEFY
ncbi:terminase large subunit [Bacteroides finegoldii]|jgi:phage terminase large subunit-like protein|uniref:terminase large subunit n=1 Tax=Bacteroides finegoldii TaxID=338188 RepID=UPI002061CAE1|nr:terminase TerL endonuclease subunit [Bacteroides finegoldii]DAU34209.1 MAG TPA: Large Terminase [Bacteriophage sp.]